jgi:long-chain acyl-CoA synthetase
VNIIQRTNALLETFEQIKCAIVLRENWTIENGFLTPSLKIKRNEIEAIYLKQYPEWYYSGKPVVWL